MPADRSQHLNLIALFHFNSTFYSSPLFSCCFLFYPKSTLPSLLCSFMLFLRPSSTSTILSPGLSCCSLCFSRSSLPSQTYLHTVLTAQQLLRGHCWDSYMNCTLQMGFSCNSKTCSCPLTEHSTLHDYCFLRARLMFHSAPALWGILWLTYCFYSWEVVVVPVLKKKDCLSLMWTSCLNSACYSCSGQFWMTAVSLFWF